MTSALRHIVDDVRGRLSRMRTREASRTEVHITAAGDGGSAAKSTDGRRTTCTQSPSASNAMTAATRNLVNSSSLVPSTTTANGLRTDTPDLIRPHAKIASLPPLPPSTQKTMTSSVRSSRNCDTSAATYLSMHVYEEIPTLSRPCRRRQRQGSATSAAQSETIGRVYYISPIDGALCRLYPTSDLPEELVERHHQLVCSHVRPGPTSRTVDIAKFVAAISTSVSGGSGSTPYSHRGRELRLCSNCRRELRENLGDSWPRRDVNTCDLSLLHVPCPYWSDNDDDYNYDGGKNSNVSKEVPELTRRCSAPAEIDRRVEQLRLSATIEKRVSINEAAAENNLSATAGGRNGSDGRRRLVQSDRMQHPRPRLGISGSSAFIKYTADRRNSMPAAGQLDPSTSPTSPRRRLQSSFCRSIENIRRLNSRGFNRTSENDIAGSVDPISPDKLMTSVRDKRRRPIVAGKDDVIIIDSLAVPVDECANDDSGYLCLYDCQCDRCRVKFAGRRRSKTAENGALHDEASRDSSNATRRTSQPPKSSDANENCANRDFKNGHIYCRQDVEANSRRYSSRQLRESMSVNSDDRPGPQQVQADLRRHQRSARSASQRFPLVRSVYYNGLLASMIDLTGCDVSTSDSSVDSDFRLSCRATSGPRSWGRDILLRSRSSRHETESYENADADNQASGNSRHQRQHQPWHKRRVSWARNHRQSTDSSAPAPTDDVRKQTSEARAVALHRSVGDLQLSSLQ